MSKIPNLKMNCGGKSVTGYVGSAAAFEELEALLGKGLPASYVDFIRTADGGHPEICCFQVPGGGSEDLVSVDWFYSIANTSVESVRSAINDYSSVLGLDALPIGRDGGGNQFYLLLSSQPASVWLYFHDEEGIKVKLSDSFEEFISGLFPDPDLS